MKWDVIVTRHVEFTQSARVRVEADTPDEAEETAVNLANANQSAQTWIDGDDALKSPAYVSAPDCVQGIDEKSNGG